MTRHWSTFVTVLTVTLALVGCRAQTPIGKAVEIADAEKQLVEAAYQEVVRLYDAGKVDQGAFDQAGVAYDKWADAQKVVAKSLAAWKSVQSAQTQAAKDTAHRAMLSAANEFLGAVSKYVDLTSLRKKLGVGLPGVTVILVSAGGR